MMRNTQKLISGSCSVNFQVSADFSNICLIFEIAFAVLIVFFRHLFLAGLWQL